MTASLLNREVPYSARRRDRAVLAAFALSWLAALALAFGCYHLIRDNRELSFRVQSLEADVALAKTSVILERAAGYEREAQAIGDFSSRREPALVAASSAPEVESRPRRRRRRRLPENRGHGSSGVELDCRDGDPLCGLGTTRSLR